MTFVRKLSVPLLILPFLLPPPSATAQTAGGSATRSSSTEASEPRTRLMDDLNWMEFAEWVPEQVSTVILTVGTLEPHGVANNGADNTAPVAIARAIAPRPGVDAFIAPHIPYGITGRMASYPGALHIPESAFRPYFQAVLEGLVKNGFRDIIVVNGHGGGQTAVLNDVTMEVSLAHGVNTLVVNWWSLASDITQEIFGSAGGHAGENETAFIQAIDPSLVLQERYTGPDMATANPAPGSWTATPFPSSITLYVAGEGWSTDFDQDKADAYFVAVVDRVAELVVDTREKWRKAGF